MTEKKKKYSTDKEKVATQPVEEQPPIDQFDPQFDQQIPVDVGYFPDYARPIQEELVYEWQAPTRPFKKHSQIFYKNVIVLVALLSFLLFFSSQWMLMIVVWAIAGMRLMMSWVPPHTENYKITTMGLRVGEELYYWEEMGYFWFTDIYKQNQVNFEIARFPNRLTLPLASTDKELMRQIVSEVLVEGIPKPTMYEQAASWLSETIPLDIEQEKKKKKKTNKEKK